MIGGSGGGCCCIEREREEGGRRGKEGVFVSNAVEMVVVGWLTGW